MTSTVTHRDYNKTCLRQSVGTHTHTGKGVTNSISLRARIDIIHNRITLFGVKIKRFVHHAIEVGYAICGLYRKCFGELVSIGKQLREITNFERHNLLTFGIIKCRLGNGIYTREVINKVTASVINDRLMIKITLIEQCYLATVKANRIEVLIEGIFALLATHCSKIDLTGFLINFEDIVNMPRAFGQATHQRSVFGIEIQMRPAIALAPLNQFLTLIYNRQWSYLDIGIHSLLNQRSQRVTTDGIRANVNTVQISARTSYIESVVTTQPHSRLIVFVSLIVLARLYSNRDCLTWETLDINLFARIVAHIEQIEVRNRALFLAWHLIFVGFKRRTRICQRIDNPQLFNLSFILDLRQEVARVWRPYAIRSTTRIVAQFTGIKSAIRLTVTKMLNTIGCHLVLDNCSILVVFFEFLVILARHTIEIEIFGIHHSFAIGRHRSPTQLFDLFLLVFEMSQFAITAIVREIEHLATTHFLGFLTSQRILFGQRFRLGFLRRGHLKCKCISILIHLQITNRQMRRHIRITNNLGQLRRKFHIVKQRFTTAFGRINHIPTCTLARLVGVPKLFA